MLPVRGVSGLIVSVLVAGVALLGATVAPAGSAPFRFFSPKSFWNEPPAAGARLDPSSVAVVGALDKEVAEEVQANSGPYINTTSWSVPVYTVGSGQSPVKVTLQDASKSPALQVGVGGGPVAGQCQTSGGRR